MRMRTMKTAWAAVSVTTQTDSASNASCKQIPSGTRFCNATASFSIHSSMSFRFATSVSQHALYGCALKGKSRSRRSRASDAIYQKIKPWTHCYLLHIDIHPDVSWVIAIVFTNSNFNLHTWHVLMVSEQSSTGSLVTGATFSCCKFKRQLMVKYDITCVHL